MGLARIFEIYLIHVFLFLCEFIILIHVYVISEHSCVCDSGDLLKVYKKTSNRDAVNVS